VTTTILVNLGNGQALQMPFRRVRRDGNVVHLGLSQWVRLLRVVKDDVSTVTFSIDGQPVQLKVKSKPHERSA